DNCLGQDADCPTKWECTSEKYTDPDTDCTKCRCKIDDPQYGSLCGPSDAPCPMDCSTMYVVDAKTGCTRCICDPEDSDNPFATPPPLKKKSWNDGCNDCTCMNGMPVCTEMACIEPGPDDFPICEGGCSKEMMEVCGSDGITYNNPCEIEFARICNGKNVKLNYTGVCGDCKPCNKRKYDPVCGDDCVTYSNACMLVWDNCEKGKDVKEAHKGRCAGDKKDKERTKRQIPMKKIKKTNIYGTKSNDEVMESKKNKNVKSDKMNPRKKQMKAKIYGSKKRNYDFSVFKK
ncbi:unnamed protein product, partial [Meganyctiphanes norvegica]